MKILRCASWGEYSHAILPLIVGTTILFEMTGPVIARWHLQQAGELSAGAGNGEEGI